MSKAIKTTTQTDSNNSIKISPDITEEKIDIGDNDVLDSHKVLEENQNYSQFLTTDCITEDSSNDSSVKVLAMSGFREYENQIMEIITGSYNNNVATIVYTDASDLTTSELYNIIHNGTVTLSGGSTYFKEDDSTFVAIDTNTGAAPENLFGIDAINTAHNTVLKINKTGWYRLTYSLHFNLSIDPAAVEVAFTPYVKMIRGKSDGGGTPKLIHHSSITVLQAAEPIPTATAYYPSFIVNEWDEITDTFTDTTPYFYNITGQATFRYDNFVDEYLGIFIGIDNSADSLTFNTVDGTNKVYCVVNIENIGV